MLRELVQADAAVQVEDPAALCEALTAMLGDPGRVAQRAMAGSDHVARSQGVLDDLVAEISPYIFGRAWDSATVEPAD